MPDLPDSGRPPVQPGRANDDYRPLPPVRGELLSWEADDRQGESQTLGQAWETALRVDRPLESRRWGVSSAQQSLGAAKAQRWPLVALDGAYTARSNEPAFRFDLAGIPLPTDTFPYRQEESTSVRARADIPLYTSGRISHGIAAAEANVNSAVLEVEISEIDLKMQVAEEYVAVLRAQRDVEVAQCTVRNLQEHVRNAEMLFKHDRVPRNDLLAAQVALSDARQTAILAHKQLEAARAAYNRRLDRPFTTPVHIAELALGRVEEDLDTLTDRALRARPELSRLTSQTQSLQHRATTVRARNLPQIQLRGAYEFEENRYQFPEGVASVGVGVSLRLFDGGRNRYEAEALTQRAKSLRWSQADLESRIALQVRHAWLDLTETRRRLELTPKAIQRAEENLRVARERYALGAAVSTEILDAQTLLTRAYRNHDNATYDAAMAVLRMRRATGELAQPPARSQ